jgi:hypothetical protein
MNINLHECDQICHSCVRNYIHKHDLKKKKKTKKSPFNLDCHGILLDPLSDSLISIAGTDKETALNVMDPVAWAANFLDWHCIDPKGEIWKRKTFEGKLGSLPQYDAERAAQGKSIFHRPYQKLMLCCTSKYKVFRIGRQAGKSESLCISILVTS